MGQEPSKPASFVKVKLHKQKRTSIDDTERPGMLKSDGRKATSPSYPLKGTYTRVMVEYFIEGNILSNLRTLVLHGVYECY